jgi:HAD superfamily hydrolase (TIGR01509 family)
MRQLAGSDNEASQPSGPKALRGVALDMDGLLFDTEKLYWQVGDRVLQRRGLRFCADLQQRMMGRIGVACMQEMVDFHSLSDSAQQLLEESDILYGELLTCSLQPMPGLADWIDQLVRSELPFGLATSSRRKFVDVILDRTAWSDQLSFVLTGDDVTNGKPHPEMYLRAADRLQVEPSEMLVLEDSGNGCAAAVAAGAFVVAVPSEHTSGHSFDGASLVADSLTDPRLSALVQL